MRRKCIDDRQTWPSMADIAELADSSLSKFTKPKPLDLPVSLSVITLAEE